MIIESGVERKKEKKTVPNNPVIVLHGHHCVNGVRSELERNMDTYVKYQLRCSISNIIMPQL